MIRIIQGISVGGEYSGAIIFAVEHFDSKRAGFVGSFIVSGCLCGVLLATLVSSLIKLPFMPDYAWRFAFLLGFVLSIVGYFIRKRLGETPVFKTIQEDRIKIPLIQGFINRKRECIVAILISAATGVNLYYVVVYLPNYLKKVTEIDLWYLPIITTATLALFSPFFGWLSDKLNRVKVITVGMGLVTLYSTIMLSLIDLNSTIAGICIVFLIHAILFSIQDGTMNTLIVEIFPPNCRFSCTAFCYSIGMGVVGGTSPAISTLITNNFAEPTMILSMYVGGISLLGFCAICFLPRKKKYTEAQEDKVLTKIKEDEMLSFLGSS
jgi:MHS family proline/betaine transporter-like MFS transporter